MVMPSFRHRAAPSRLQHGGFTLVEVLVVVSIIAVLASLLMPSLKLVREQAQRTHCQSNLRQLGIALEAYRNDNDALAPAATGYCGYRIYFLASAPDCFEGFGRLWSTGLLTNARVLYAPSDREFTLANQWPNYPAAVPNVFGGTTRGSYVYHELKNPLSPGQVFVGGDRWTTSGANWSVIHNRGYCLLARDGHVQYHANLLPGQPTGVPQGSATIVAAWDLELTQ
jgi:prepilin-type N-terminal cleavage/methylation domain-containing protein